MSTQKEGEGEKCPFDFLRRKILPGYDKLPKVEGENVSMWTGERLKHHSGEAIHCFWSLCQVQELHVFFFSYFSQDNTILQMVITSHTASVHYGD